MELEIFNFEPSEMKDKKPTKKQHLRTFKQKENEFNLRKYTSEAQLENELDWHFTENASYHCLSFGDVDSLSYFRFIARQQKIRYALFSTWCMATEDCTEIENMIERGIIKKADFYVGEIFQSSYALVYAKLKEICEKHGGRVAVFRNHSKVMVIKGEKFDAVIESSANINTNPRCENTVITINKELADYYKNFFDEIKSFNKDFENWKPQEVKK